MKLTKENLYQKYIIENLTREQCAKHFNCGGRKINDCLVLWGIKKNNISENINIGQIKYEYMNLGLSPKEIALNHNCSRTTICRIIRKYNLRRNEEELALAKNRQKEHRSSSRTIYNFVPEELIQDIQNGITEEQLSLKYGCSESCINKFINKKQLSQYKNLEVINRNKQKKLEQTNLAKYGVKNVFQSNEIKRKIMGTNLEKYGVTIAIKNEAVKRKAVENKVVWVTPISKPEIELRNVISSFYDGEITRYHDGKYELDIYCPERKVGIEYNGNYWHSIKNKDKNYHYDKSKYFDEKGIRVIHIFEYEWNNERQRPILINIIQSALGINQEKIYARKCKIEVRKSAEMKDFFNKNNIQGFRGGKFAICLVYNDEVVMSYIMGSCFFGKGKYQWEVIRGATKLGVTVVGGASKIWNYFLREYQPDNCVYYIDYNYFNGSSLPYLGLQYLKSQVGFKNWWVNDNVVKNREPLRHKKIIEAYKSGECIPIYNAGTKVYVYEKEHE